MMTQSDQKLFEAAQAAMAKAHAPYTGHKVGAALLATDGKIYAGCNIEFPSIGLTLCSERGAIHAAVIDSAKSFQKIWIVHKGAGTPCGSCRQALFDICREIEVIVSEPDGSRKKIFKSSELLPHPYDDSGW